MDKSTVCYFFLRHGVLYCFMATIVAVWPSDNDVAHISRLAYPVDWLR